MTLETFSRYNCVRAVRGAEWRAPRVACHDCSPGGGQEAAVDSKDINRWARLCSNAVLFMDTEIGISYHFQLSWSSLLIFFFFPNSLDGPHKHRQWAGSGLQVMVRGSWSRMYETQEGGAPVTPPLPQWHPLRSCAIPAALGPGPFLKPLLQITKLLSRICMPCF